MRAKYRYDALSKLLIGALFFFAITAYATPTIAVTLRGNLRDDLPNVDPAAFNGPIGHRILSLVYEGLTAISPEGRLIPALATRWETLDDGRAWRFHLRPNVRFHSGRPFTARDVRLSFEALIKAKRPAIGAQFLQKLHGRAAFQRGEAQTIAGIVEIDPLTVEMRFEEPQAAFPYYPFFIFDSGAEAAWGAGWRNTHSGGTGPFVLASWRRGRDLTLEANRQYWGPTPAADGVQFINTPSVDTALTMFDVGELDFVAAAEPAHQLIAADPRRSAALQTAERMQARFLAMNAAVYPPFADPRVRAAVSLAIDRDAVTAGVFGGLATAPNGFGVGRLLRLSNTSPIDPPPPHRYDPAAARELLAQAGYRNGDGLPPIEMTVIDFTRNEGAYYAEQLNKELGMPVTLKVMERAAIVSAANSGKLGLFVGGWTADFPDPLTYLDAIWHGASPYNQARWRDPTYDALVDKARQTPDAAARAKLYIQAERRLSETAAAAMLPTPHNMLLRNPAAEKLVSITPFGHLAFTPRDGAPAQ